MTADEIAFAGGKNGTSLTSPYAWYYTNGAGGSITGASYWWLLSPYNTDFMFYVDVEDYSGDLPWISLNTEDVAIRPAISIDACAKVTGTGTVTDPYVIDETNSVCS